MIKNQKAEILNSKTSDPKNKPDQILKTLELRTGQTVADIGAGGGYFTLRFSEIVGKNGRVIAIDTEPKFLEYIRNSLKEKRVGNVETLLTKKESLTLPDKSVDLIFMRNVCHHILNRSEYFRHLKNALEKDGKIAIIDYKDKGKLSFHRIFGHYIAKEKIINEMKDAGYKLIKDENFLPEQSFTVFSLNEP